MIKKLKKILAVFLSLGIALNSFIINIGVVNADDLGLGDIEIILTDQNRGTEIFAGSGEEDSEDSIEDGGGGPGTPSESDETTNEWTSEPDDDGWALTCEWNVSTSSSEGVYTKVYDTEGEQMPINNLDLSLAGRYIGLDVYEIKSYSKTASLVDIYAKRTVYEYGYCASRYYQVEEEAEPPSTGGGNGGCNIIPTLPGRPAFDYATCGTSSRNQRNNIQQMAINNERWVCENDDWDTAYFSSESECSDNYGGCYSTGLTSSETREEEEVTSDERNACWQQMKNSISTRVELKSSAKVTYRDSNDINVTGPSTDKYNTYLQISEGVEEGCGEKTPSLGNEMTYKKACIWNYNRNKTCINVKNGKVRYITNSESCDTDTEYLLPSNEDYWYYFIPLNANSADDFSFETSSTRYSRITCENYINSSINSGTNWRDTINDENNSPFENNISNQECINRVANGCYLKKSVKIPVEQKFYNEMSTTGNFKGFNFYYKPIDVSNPFPNNNVTNPLTESSLWYDWQTTGTPTLTSGGTVTYYAELSNVSKIKKYTKENDYTDWSKMYKTGESKFIEKQGIVTRYVARNSFYKLGCGPANADWNECDKS